MSETRDRQLVGKNWLDLPTEDVQYILDSNTLYIDGSSKIRWRDPSRRELVTVHLFGALAQADLWIRRTGYAPLSGTWVRPSNIIEGDIEYPLFEQLVTPQLVQVAYSCWCNQNAPRVRPHIREVLRTLRDYHDVHVKVLYPSISDSWDQGVRLWLTRKGFGWTLNKPYPNGADPADFLDDSVGYIDNHPERCERARKKGVKKVSLLANAWNDLEGLKRVTPDQIISQYDG